MPETTYEQVAEKHARHLNPQFVKLLNTFGYGRLFTRAQDVWVWDSEGRKYLDLVAAYGSNNLGHHHPRIHRRIRETLERAPYNFLHFGLGESAANLAEELARSLGEPYQVSLFSSSGSEAVEAAMKLAVAVTGRARFIRAANGYHGTGIGSLALMGHPKLRGPFGPILPQCSEVPFGSLPELEALLKTQSFAAFVVEPVQCEGGMAYPPASYLDDALALCRRYKTLFVLDEVQTGLGRTGKWYACHGMKDRPDAIVLAKSLSGGLMPIAATVTTADLHRKAYGTAEKYDLHGSTFGGNALSCEVALETLSVLRDEKLVENSAAQGALLLSELKARLASHPMVKGIRGEGLLVAIELGPTDQGLLNRLAPGIVASASKLAFGQWISYCLIEKGILLQPTTHHWNVLKVEPPLTIREPEIRAFAETLSGVFAEYQGFLAFAKDITQQLFSNMRS